MENQPTPEMTTQTPTVATTTKNNNGLILGVAVAALLVGGGIGYVAAESSHGHNERGERLGAMMEKHDMEKGELRERIADRMQDMHDMHEDESTPTMAEMMHNMNAALEGKSGAEFDAAFLSEMIVHHQGAIEMAELALENASDPRITALAEAIITAQTAEIADMESWQSAIAE